MMPRTREPHPRTSRLTVLAALAAVALGAWIFYAAAHRASRGGEHSPLFTARRYDPFGAAALYELLKMRGVAVRFLQSPRPAPGDHGTLIQVVATPEEQSAPAERQLDAGSLQDWMEAGNTVLQFASAPTLLTSRLLPRPGLVAEQSTWQRLQRRMQSGQRTPDDLIWQEVTASWRVEPGELFPGAPADLAPLLLHEPGSLPAEPDAVWRPLADWNGQVVAGERAVGDGRLIVVASPTPALNLALAESGNLEFILGVIGGGPVLIDEWSHGLGRGDTMVGLLRHLGLLPVVAQILLVAGLYVWTTRGHPRQDPGSPPRRRSSAEQVLTLGHLYSQVLGADEIRRRIVQEARRRLAGALRCSPADLEVRLARLPSKAAAEAAGLLRMETAAPPRSTDDCHCCGYSLAGNTSGVCPECGTPVQTQRSTPAPDAPRRRHEFSRREQSQAEAEARRLVALADQLARELMRERNERARPLRHSAAAG